MRGWWMATVETLPQAFPQERGGQRSGLTRGVAVAVFSREIMRDLDLGEKGESEKKKGLDGSGSEG